jgi:hypothetical protein
MRQCTPPYIGCEQLARQLRAIASNTFEQRLLREKQKPCGDCFTPVDTPTVVGLSLSASPP